MFSYLPKDIRQLIAWKLIESNHSNAVFNLLQVDKEMKTIIGDETITPQITDLLNNRKFNEAILFKQNPALISKILNDKTINITPKETIDLLIQLGEEKPALALVVADYFRKTDTYKKLFVYALDDQESAYQESIFRKLPLDELALFILTRKMIVDSALKGKNSQYKQIISKLLSDNILTQDVFPDEKLLMLTEIYLSQFKEKLKNIKEDKELEEYKESHPEYQIIEIISWLCKVSIHNTDPDPDVDRHPMRHTEQISHDIQAFLTEKYSNPHLKGLYINLSGLDLSYLQLAGTCLSGFDFSGSDLTKSDFQGANLASTDMSSSCLDDVNMRSANLIGCQLANTRSTKSVKFNGQTKIITTDNIRDNKMLVKTLNKFPIKENWAKYIYLFLEKTFVARLESLNTSEPNYLQQVKAIKMMFETAATQPLFTQYSKTKKILGSLKQSIFHKEYKTSIQKAISIQIAKLDEIVRNLERKPEP